MIMNWVHTTTGCLLLDGDGNHLVFIAKRDGEHWVYRQMDNAGSSKLALNPFPAPIEQKYAVYKNLTVAKQAGYKIALEGDM